MRGTWQTTDSSGGSRGGLALVVLVAAIALGSGAVSAAVSALVTMAIIFACTVTVAVLAGIGVLIWRALRSPRMADRRPAGVPATPVSRPQLEETRKPAALNPGREIHLHLNVTPDQLAAIMRHYTGENQP